MLCLGSWTHPGKEHHIRTPQSLCTSYSTSNAVDGIPAKYSLGQNTGQGGLDMGPTKLNKIQLHKTPYFSKIHESMYLQGATSETLRSAGFSAVLIQQPISEFTPQFPVFFSLVVLFSGQICPMKTGKAKLSNWAPFG